MSNHAHNELGWLFILINDYNWILLIDCILMAWGSRNFASLICIKGGIYDHIYSVNYNLGDSFAIHGVLEIQLLLNVDFTFNGIILNFIIDDVIKDVLVL